jgi:hypothetical protein
VNNFLVASTSAAPGWSVYTKATGCTKNIAPTAVRVAVGGEVYIIPKSAIKIHTANREDAERAARMLNTIDRQHGEALAAAGNLRRTATALLVEQYE